MPSSLSEIQSELWRIPELRALRTYAKRLGIRVYIRGGVVRNLLFTFGKCRGHETSLFDFVDPFSDIDILIDPIEHWPEFLGHVLADIPFAAFHSWDCVSEAVALAEMDKYGQIQADRFTIEIVISEEENEKQFRFGGLAMDPVVAWDGYLSGQGNVEIRLDKLLASSSMDEAGSSEEAKLYRAIIAILMLTRYVHQFGDEEIAFPDTVRALEILRAVVNAQLYNIRLRQENFGRQAKPVPQLLQERFEISLLSLLFTSHRLKDSIAAVTNLPASFEMSAALVSMLNVIAEVSYSTGWIGATAYRPAPGWNVTRDLKWLPQLILDGHGNIPPPVMPWTPLTAEGGDWNDCCRYRDFQCGPAVVTWRMLDDVGQSNFHPKDSEKLYAAMMKIDWVGLHETNDESKRYIGFSVPGIVHNGPALTARIDHGYARARLTRNQTLYFGLLDAPRQDKSYDFD